MRIARSDSREVRRRYWGYALNLTSRSWEAVAASDQSGDEVLFAYDFFDKAIAEADRARAPCRSASPPMYRWRWAPRTGTIDTRRRGRPGAVTTDADGRDDLVRLARHQAVKADRAGSVRSATTELCVNGPGEACENHRPRRSGTRQQCAARSDLRAARRAAAAARATGAARDGQRRRRRGGGEDHAAAARTRQAVPVVERPPREVRRDELRQAVLLRRRAGPELVVPAAAQAARGPLRARREGLRPVAQPRRAVRARTEPDRVLRWSAEVRQRQGGRPARPGRGEYQPRAGRAGAGDGRRSQRDAREAAHRPGAHDDRPRRQAALPQSPARRHWRRSPPGCDPRTIACATSAAARSARRPDRGSCS